MSSDRGKITLMVPVTSSQSPDYEDRGGGEQYGLIVETFQRIVSSKQIDPEALERNMERIINQIDELLNKISGKLTSSWKVENICVGLSLNAEGSVGFATAGIESSIEISFSPK